MKRPSCFASARRHSSGHTWGRNPSPWTISSLLLLLLALPAAPAEVVKIERVSPPPLDLEVPLPGRTPVISADGRPETMAQVHAAGLDYLAKPVKPAALRALLSRHLPL